LPGRVTTQGGNPCPAQPLRPLTADDLSQLHIALTARIAELERIMADEPAEVSPELVAMVKAVDYDVTEARRAL